MASASARSCASIAITRCETGDGGAAELGAESIVLEIAVATPLALASATLRAAGVVGSAAEESTAAGGALAPRAPPLDDGQMLSSTSVEPRRDAPADISTSDATDRVSSDATPLAPEPPSISSTSDAVDASKRPDDSPTSDATSEAISELVVPRRGDASKEEYTSSAIDDRSERELARRSPVGRSIEIDPLDAPRRPDSSPVSTSDAISDGTSDTTSDGGDEPEYSTALVDSAASAAACFCCAFSAAFSRRFPVRISPSHACSCRSSSASSLISRSRVRCWRSLTYAAARIASAC